MRSIRLLLAGAVASVGLVLAAPTAASAWGPPPPPPLPPTIFLGLPGFGIIQELCVTFVAPLPHIEICAIGT
ncbi:MAG: hypothetical protein ACYDH6_03470 [Acidimicrobiales bacterium]